MPFVGAMPLQVRPRVRRRQVTTVVAASMAAVALIAGSVFVVRSFDRSAIVPAPQPTESLSPETHWSLQTERGTSPIYETRRWEDPLDASLGWVDLTRVSYPGGSQVHWYLELAEPPPLDRGPGQVLSYGLVLDTNADGDADHLIGIEDSQSDSGDFRVWVTDLATGETEEQVGPPYGYPIEFGHPDEALRGEPRDTMWFTFLGASEPDDMDHGSVRFSTRGRP